MDNFVLVNNDNPIGRFYMPEDLVVCDNNENNFHEYVEPLLKPMIKKEVFDHFDSLRYNAIKEGLDIIIDSGFRSYSYQGKLWMFNFEKNYRLLKEEYPFEEDYKIYKMAENLTERTTALPGYSEHQTGLAIDYAIKRDGVYTSKIDSTIEDMWMRKNAYKYGFILRYPEGKESITGYDFEPWHYRYIGYPYSEECEKEGLTLEEYVLKLKK